MKCMYAEIVENGQLPGALRHKMTGGTEHRMIFRGDEDRDELLDTLESLLPVTKTACYDRLQIPERALSSRGGWAATGK